jgi:hypothetical protein
MKKGIRGLLFVVSFLILITGSLCVSAATVGVQDYKATPVSISSGTPGVLYEPVAPGTKDYVGLFIMHNFSDSLRHVAAIELSKRGYRVLAANGVYANNPGSDQDWDKMMFQVRDGVNYLLTKVPGIQKVILIGHSSGAPMMATYQNVAENGAAKACQGSEKIIKCPGTFTDFHPADGLILLDPVIGGMAANTLVSIDPALINEKNAQVVEPSLDMFDPRNGFSPNGATYSEKFKRRFLKEEAHRMHKLIDTALHRLKKIEAGQGRYADDEPFVVMGARPTDIKLWRPDLSLLKHTRNEHILLTQNGPKGPQKIYSVRVPSGTTRQTASYNDALTTSVRRFLSTFATRTTRDFNITEDNITGIDWNSSYNSTPGNVEGVKVPILILGMTGHYWIVSSEIAYEHAASSDKTVAFVEGALHGFNECVECRVNNGNQPFGDTVKTTFDYAASWLSPRF